MATAGGARLELSHELKQRLERLEYCKVVNAGTNGPSVLWWVLPKGRDAKEIYAEVCEGRLPADRFAQFAGEIRRLFEKRERALDPMQDARLSFTTSIGHSPHGIALPAWKAVFFNPRTDRTVIDRLIYSIEELL